ncbi:MAG: glucose-6-phosphate isomerase [Christensenellales bacterium]|jgi:glucose-6-phosphate isomerase
MAVQPIRFDYNNMTSDALGSRGFGEGQIKEAFKLSKTAHAKVEAERGQGMRGWMNITPPDDETVSEILSTAKEIRKKFDYFVVLGIGGSALGPLAAFQALCHFRHNELPKSKRKAPKFYVEENVDPERMTSLFDVIDLKKTMFNVVSKSGSTSETMSQYLIIADALKKRLGDKAREHIIVTTSKTSGSLIKIAEKEGFKAFYIPDGVGGRFSQFSPVGLLPAAVLRIDIKSFLRGAIYMDKKCGKADPRKNPALAGAALSYLSMQTGKNISVIMPYADSLRLVGDWYCQLWAESLGKAVNLKGETVNAGQTPVGALGVTDQHSQVQLYTEGPFDKVLTFIEVENYRSKVRISDGLEDVASVNFLCGHTLNELIKAELYATEYALAKNGRLNCKIILPEVNAHTLGQLLMMFMLQTAYAGAMLGIDAFNQPGVEEGKNAAYALLGRPGYEQKAAELASAPPKQSKYIIE